jgi:hypothetical protein
MSILVIAFVFYFEGNKKVIIQNVQSKNDLVSEAVEWIDSKNNEKGVHVLRNRSDSVEHEFLIYVNLHEGKNLYQYSDVSAKVLRDKLIIEVDDRLANDDGMARDTTLKLLVLKKAPKETLLYINGEIQNSTLENGMVSEFIK